MEIFDSKEKFILDTSNEKSYSLGTFGVIYKKDNQCIKVFNEFNVSKEPFIILKSLNLSCCYQIIDYLYNIKKDFAGYKTPFYESDNFDILQNKEFLLREINGVYDGIFEFNRKGVLAADLHPGNVIVTRDGMKLIDIDSFLRTNEDNSFLNNYRVKILIKNLIIKYLLRYNISNIKEAYDLVNHLIDIDHMGLDILNKEIMKYDQPIEYFRKVLK